MFVIPILGLVAACGSNVGLFGPQPDDGGSGGAGGAASTTSSLSGSSTADGGASAADTSASVGGAGGTMIATATSSVTASSVTASSVTASSVTATTATGGGPMVSIPCGNDTCVTGEVCCVGVSGQNTVACAAVGACGVGSISVGCNSAADCAVGQVCCGAYSNVQQQYQSVKCAEQCTSNNPGMPAFVMCAGDADCPPNDQCKDSVKLPDGFGYCD
ncbi:MAG: hypothetical protein EXR75_13465 [Myxococcales bacterium]|nr:hypothetical protein [Myxococcales bacterium]